MKKKKEVVIGVWSLNKLSSISSVCRDGNFLCQTPISSAQRKYWNHDADLIDMLGLKYADQGALD